jgi:predicted RNA binding protein YcfA (HicA-like mRNA interferase family)
MAIYTYDQFRKVLEKLEFRCIRSTKHETWHKISEGGMVYYVRVSHKGKKDIPKWLFSKMLKQAGITKEGFKKVLKDE